MFLRHVRHRRRDNIGVLGFVQRGAVRPEHDHPYDRCVRRAVRRGLLLSSGLLYGDGVYLSCGVILPARLRECDAMPRGDVLCCDWRRIECDMHALHGRYVFKCDGCDG